MGSERAADILVVVPLYRQPLLVTEAIDSALRQDGGVAVRVLVVDDGCPFPETNEILNSFSATFPERFVAVRQKNKGLSAARNLGIELGLKLWSDWHALYFLDADNRIERNFLSKALTALQSGPDEVGFAYPDIDMFGFEAHYDTSGTFSKLALLAENYVEAGSLVSRRMLESGLRFDESMRLGFEDWDFWISAALAGWKGVHIPAAGFRYRRRGESMLLDSERNRAEILAYLRRKHKADLTPSALIRLEHFDAPRFLFFEREGAEHDALRCATDPELASGTLTRAALLVGLTDALNEHIPPYFVFAAPAVLVALRKAKILRGLLASAERALEDCHFAVFTIERSDTEGRIAISVDGELGDTNSSSMVVVAGTTIASVVRDPSESWVQSLEADLPRPKIHHQSISMQEMPASDGSVSAIEMMLQEIRWLRHVQATRVAPARPWRENARRAKSQSAQLIRELAQTGPLYPLVRVQSELNIAFLVPCCEFGGVERVVQNYARVFRRSGFRCHLFVCGARTLVLDETFREDFDSVALVSGADFSIWSDVQVYQGVGSTRILCDSSLQPDLLGWFAGMDVVFNAHVADAHSVMAALRRFGATTICNQHLVERDRWNRPIGNFHLAAAYEYAYDLFAVISEGMRITGLSLGIPAAKLVVVPNAPSYPVHERSMEAYIQHKTALSEREPVHCLYLGRLDRQKGIDHLSAIIRATDGSRIRWRIVGKPIIDDQPESFAEISDLIEPAVYSPQHLEALYEWADIVVLPSRFEGVPLTILEAQRAGCVVVATNVGAVCEVIRDGIDGILIESEDPSNVPGLFIATLDALCKNPGWRCSLARAAVSAGRDRDWNENLSVLVEKLRA